MKWMERGLGYYENMKKKFESIIEKKEKWDILDKKEEVKEMMGKRMIIGIKEKEEEEMIEIINEKKKGRKKRYEEWEKIKGVRILFKECDKEYVKMERE